MAQPRNLDKFDKAPKSGRTWRIAHLSDIHVVGERYGRRIESGRSGPCGNERLRRLLKQLEALDAKHRLDTILITGDMTDAGISTEWAEVLDALAAHPVLRRARADAARQSRSQHRRSRQPGAHGPAHQSEPAAASDQVPVRHERGPGPARARGRSQRRSPRRHAGRGVAAARGCLGAVRRHRAADPLQGDPGGLGAGLSHDRTPRQAGRPRHHPAQFQCRHAFLLHQCARHGVGGADARRRHRRAPNIPTRAG